MSKYEKRIFLGYDENGKRIQKRIHANTKVELQEKEYALRHSDSPSYVDFGEYADTWLKTYKANNSSATTAAYERILRLHCKDISWLPLNKVTRADCQKIFNAHSDEPPLCKKIYTTLNQIFVSAMVDGYLIKNPLTGIKTPSLQKVQRRTLSADEKQKIATAELDDMDRLYLECLLYLGLRPAEASALMAEDFNLNAETVTIQRAFEYPHNQPIVKSTKTGSIRVLPIPSAWHPVLPKKGYLFHHNGEPLSKTEARTMFRHIKKAIGDSDLHPYIFRYNYATQLYYSGISIKKAAYLMGHASTSMMLRVYAQIDEERESISILKSLDFTN